MKVTGVKKFKEFLSNLLNGLCTEDIPSRTGYKETESSAEVLKRFVRENASRLCGACKDFGEVVSCILLAQKSWEIRIQLRLQNTNL